MSDEHVSRRKALTGGAAALAGVTAALAVSAVTRNAHADNASDATALNAVRTKAFEIIAVYDTLIGPLNREPMTAASGALFMYF